MFTFRGSDNADIAIENKYYSSSGQNDHSFGIKLSLNISSATAADIFRSLHFLETEFSAIGSLSCR